jgi:alpha-1,2-rhamnosyltransferase
VTGGAVRRLFYDVSFTRTQPGAVGITRTVRRLLSELSLRADPRFSAPVTVAFHSEGFREVAFGDAAQASSLAKHSLYRTVSGGLARRLLAGVLLLPWRLVRPWWGAASTLVFNRMTSNARPVTFRAGDVLLHCDAGWNYEAWHAAARARAAGASSLLLVYDLIPLRDPQFCYPLTTLAFREWLHRMLPLVDGVVCISQSVQRDLESYAVEHGLHMPPAAFVHLGCNVPHATEEGSRLAGFMQGGPTYLCVGSVEPRKNHAQLLDAFEALWVSGGGQRLLVAGKGTAESADVVARMQAHPDNGSRLMYLPDMTDAELVYAYRHARAVVLPTLAEGFGLPLVEARALGCRVIASDLAVFGELADEGVEFFAAGSVDGLRAAIERDSRISGRSPPPRQLRTWSDAAGEFIERIDQLLSAGTLRHAARV